MAMERREKKMLTIAFGFKCQSDVFDTIEDCAIDVISKQRFLLTYPLSRSLAFWGVHCVPPGCFPENGREGYGWY